MNKQQLISARNKIAKCLEALEQFSNVSMSPGSVSFLQETFDDLLSIKKEVESEINRRTRSKQDLF